MPRKMPSPCSRPGCGRVSEDRFCAAHAKEYRQASDAKRGTSSQRGYGSRWRKAREGFLKSNPLCVRCGAKGLTVAASVVDHIVPHKGDKGLFWQRSNWQALCKQCHDRKTATEDGAFGRAVRG